MGTVSVVDEKQVMRKISKKVLPFIFFALYYSND